MIKLKSFVLVILFVLTFQSCYTPISSKRIGFASVNNNVCKKLTGKVILYAIFVDSKYTNPWSSYDIESTLDSIESANNWIENQAIRDSVFVDIQLVYHSTPEGIIPIKNDLTKKTLSETLYKIPQWTGIRDIHRWADKIAKEAGKSLPKDTSPMTNMKNDLKTRERLIARLRDIHRTDKVALMYFINNYYKDEISVTFDITSDNDVEYSVVSFKNPPVIAHEFLHLFGAYDLYLTPFDTKKRDKKKKEKLMELFPGEIMAFAHRNIDSLNMSGFTKYLIGWDNELAQKYQDLLFDKGYFAVKY